MIFQKGEISITGSLGGFGLFQPNTSLFERMYGSSNPYAPPVDVIGIIYATHGQRGKLGKPTNPFSLLMSDEGLGQEYLSPTASNNFIE